MRNQKEILLESGTNELEIVEFGIGANTFGINVLKVKEIINPAPIIPIPHSHPYVEGIMELRGEVLTVINLEKVLGFAPSETPEKDKFIVSAFNQSKIIFHVHEVTQIHRISWTDIEKPSDMYRASNTQVIGVIKFNGKMILLLDFEKIVLDINPNSGISVEQVKRLGKRERSNKRLLVVEDSPLLRSLLQDTLKEAGYDQVISFENGRDALHYIKEQTRDGKSIEDVAQLMITDLEMPQMDGHHLTKVVKEDGKLANLPIVIFSSLITDDLRHKGEKVGADAQISKPEINNLIQVVDEKVL